MKKTLRQHYNEKRDRYGIDVPAFFDRDLKRIFGYKQPRIVPGGSKKPLSGSKPRSAAAFLQRHRAQLRRTCARGTGEHAYAVDQMIQDMILRCREMKLNILRPERDEEEIKLEVVILLSVHTIGYLNKAYHRIPM